MNWYQRAIFKFAQQGEYWITSGGQVMMADGDVGDYNHEGYVIESVRHDIVSNSEFSHYADMEYIDWDEWMQKMEEFVAAERAAESRPVYEGDAYVAVMEELGKMHSAEELEIAEGQGDAREYAMKNWGWKRLEGTHVETWTFTAGDMGDIINGLFDAYGELDMNTEISIYVHSAGKWYHTTLQDMEDKGPEEIINPVQHTQIQDAYQNAFDAIDKPSNPFYKDWN